MLFWNKQFAEMLWDSYLMINYTSKVQASMRGTFWSSSGRRQAKAQPNQRVLRTMAKLHKKNDAWTPPESLVKSDWWSEMILFMTYTIIMSMTFNFWHKLEMETLKETDIWHETWFKFKIYDDLK